MGLSGQRPARSAAFIACTASLVLQNKARASLTLLYAWKSIVNDLTLGLREAASIHRAAQRINKLNAIL